VSVQFAVLGLDLLIGSESECASRDVIVKPIDPGPLRRYVGISRAPVRPFKLGLLRVQHYSAARVQSVHSKAFICNLAMIPIQQCPGIVEFIAVFAQLFCPDGQRSCRAGKTGRNGGIGCVRPAPESGFSHPRLGTIASSGGSSFPDCGGSLVTTTALPGFDLHR